MPTRHYDGMQGLFVHPVRDAGVMAGNGGGRLSCGIATAVRALKPDARVYAAKVERSATFAAALAAGKPTTIDCQPSFVDGIGSTSVLEDMWPLAHRLLDRSLVVTLAEVAEAIRVLAERNHLIAEGTGATPVAAAMSGKAGTGKAVWVVSGGNIDFDPLARIFRREM